MIERDLGKSLRSLQTCVILLVCDFLQVSAIRVDSLTQLCSTETNKQGSEKYLGKGERGVWVGGWVSFGSYSFWGFKTVKKVGALSSPRPRPSQERGRQKNRIFILLVSIMPAYALHCSLRIYKSWRGEKKVYFSSASSCVWVSFTWSLRCKIPTVNVLLHEFFRKQRCQIAKPRSVLVWRSRHWASKSESRWAKWFLFEAVEWICILQLSLVMDRVKEWRCYCSENESNWRNGSRSWRFGFRKRFGRVSKSIYNKLKTQKGKCEVVAQKGQPPFLFSRLNSSIPYICISDSQVRVGLSPSDAALFGSKSKCIIHMVIWININQLNDLFHRFWKWSNPIAWFHLHHRHHRHRVTALRKVLSCASSSSCPCSSSCQWVWLEQGMQKLC